MDQYYGIVLVLLYFALWLVQKTQSHPCHLLLPTLQLMCLFLLWVLISSLWYFPLFWLVIVIRLVFVLQHWIKMRSRYMLGWGHRTSRRSLSLIGCSEALRCIGSESKGGIGDFVHLRSEVDLDMVQSLFLINRWTNGKELCLSFWKSQKWYSPSNDSGCT